MFSIGERTGVKVGGSDGVVKSKLEDRFKRHLLGQRDVPSDLKYAIRRAIARHEAGGESLQTLLVATPTVESLGEGVSPERFDGEVLRVGAGVGLVDQWMRLLAPFHRGLVSESIHQGVKTRRRIGEAVQVGAVVVLRIDLNKCL